MIKKQNSRGGGWLHGAHRVRWALQVVGVACLLAGCAQTYVKPELNNPDVGLERAAGEIADDQLLDVRIKSFDPGELAEADAKKQGLSKEVRKVEAYYMAVQLRNTMQQSGYWGAVRVVPKIESGTELAVYGRILQSDGESLKIEVTVKDSRGVEWFTKEYDGVVDDAAYKKASEKSAEPFQFVYNEIANDIASYRGQVAKDGLKAIRNVAEMRFAGNFAPKAFDGYVEKTDKPPAVAADAAGGGSDFLAGLFATQPDAAEDAADTAPPRYYRVVRLPSAEDPMMQRVRRVRVSENQVVDAIDRQYDQLAIRIKGPYVDWRKSRLTEIDSIREVEAKRDEKVGGAVLLGVLGMVASIAIGANCSSCVSSSAALAGATAGAAIQMAMAASEKASKDVELHESALEELGQSIADDVEPVVVEVEGTTVQLKGTAEAKFEQWRQVMTKLYEREVGPAVVGTTPASATGALTN